MTESELRQEYALWCASFEDTAGKPSMYAKMIWWHDKAQSLAAASPEPLNEDDPTLTCCEESYREGWNDALASSPVQPVGSLTFDEFQRVNKHRCETKFHQCDTWLPSGWPLAIAGEAGELCNLIKKVIRGDFTFESQRGEILKELADVMIYCDLMITAMGARTGEVVAEKFDEVSRRVGYTENTFAQPVGSADKRKK